MTIPKKLIQWFYIMTLICIGLALLRRPIHFLLNDTSQVNAFTGWFFNCYRHWVYLLGFNVTYYDLPGQTTPLAVRMSGFVGALLGIVTTVPAHLLGVFGIGQLIKNGWNYISEDKE